MQHKFLFLLFFFPFLLNAQCIEAKLLESADSSNKIRGFYTLSFPHKDTGWVINYGGDRLIKTCDGGKTWQKQLGFPDATLNFPFYCHFKNTKIGMLTHAGFKEKEVLRTEDGGKTWKKQSTFLGQGWSKSGRLFGLTFFNDKEGLLGGDSTIWKTKDGGITWEKKLEFVHPTPDYRAAILYFSKADSVAYGCSATETSYKTKDRGETWTKLDNINPTYPSATHGGYGHYNMHFVNKNQGVYVGQNSFRVTKDGGKTWKAAMDEKLLYLSGLSFSDSLTGWVAGWTLFENVAHFFHTKDGGDTWKKVYLNGEYPTALNIFNMQFVTKHIGYTVGQDAVYKLFVDTIPLCKTKLLNNKDSLFKIGDKLTWKNARNCTEGYKISIGKTPYGIELYNKYDVKNDTFWQLPKALPSNSKIYITITPYNQYGEGEVCTTTALFTEKTINSLDLSDKIATAKVYPNPFSNEVNIELYAFSTLKLQGIILYNTVGQQIKCYNYNEQLDIGTCTKNIDLSDFSKGTYFLKIQTNEGNWITTVVHI